MLEVALWWGMSQLLPTLEARTMEADRLEAVRKNDLFSGDSVLVLTKNSVYAIRALGEGLYEVSGGWFDRHGGPSQVVTINGCTWGGSAIKQDIVAARGLFLEFGNRVVTTRIRDILLIRGDQKEQHGDLPTQDNITTTLPPAVPKHRLN
jgi:hypothetical protein